jgi:hypothetical protein
MAAALLLLVLSCLVPQSQGGCVEDGLLDRVGAELLRRAGPDFTAHEQAAFLIHEQSGVGCVLWPSTDESARATYEGRPPENAVAIIHTHPHGWFMPSQVDRLLSIRVGLPVVVVTPSRITAVNPDGSMHDRHRLPTPGTAPAVCSFMPVVADELTAPGPAAR